MCSDASCPLNKTLTPKSMPLDSSQEIKLSLSPSFGTTWEDSSRPRALRDKFLLLTRSSSADQITSKPSESSLDTSPELETTTCTRSTEMFPWMVLSVNFTLRWQEITELLLILSPSSEPQSSPRRIKSEDPEPSNTEIQRSDFPFCALLIVPVKGDSDPSSEPPGQTHSANDHDYLKILFIDF